MEHWDEGVYRIQGRTQVHSGTCDAKPLILSCGVHGDETAPVQVLQQLLDDIHNRRFSVQRPCLLIFGNPPAIAQGRRHIRHNLNRLFGLPHHPPGYEGERAANLEQYCRDFRDLFGTGWHLDLHATIKPSRHRHFALQPLAPHPYNSRWPAALAQAGFTALVQQTTPAHTFAHFTANALGYDSFTLECGDIANGAPDTTATGDRLDHFVRQLLSHDELAGGNAHPQHYRVAIDLIRHSADFHFAVDEKGENFATFPRGTVIAREDGKAVQAPVDNCALLFANSQVPVGDRAGLLLETVND